MIPNNKHRFKAWTYLFMVAATAICSLQIASAAGDDPMRGIRVLEKVVPREIMQTHLEGTVLVRATFTQPGKPSKVEVARSSKEPLLDKWAVDSVTKYYVLERSEATPTTRLLPVTLRRH